MNKFKITELNVDFIGGQGPLTIAEEKAISEFIKSRKLMLNKKKISKPKSRVAGNKKVIA